MSMHKRTSCPGSGCPVWANILKLLVTFLPFVAITQYSKVACIIFASCYNDWAHFLATHHSYCNLIFSTHLMKNLILFYVCSNIHPEIIENSQTSTGEI